MLEVLLAASLVFAEEVGALFGAETVECEHLEYFTCTISYSIAEFKMVC